EGAGLGIAWDDSRLTALQRLDSHLAEIEAQSPLSLGLVLAMAGKAVPCKNRPDIAVEIDLPQGRHAGFAGRRESPPRDRQAEDHDQKSIRWRGRFVIVAHRRSQRFLVTNHWPQFTIRKVRFPWTSPLGTGAGPVSEKRAGRQRRGSLCRQAHP